MRYAMAIDTRKCVGCGDCVVACNMENKVPEGYSRSWVTEWVSGQYPNTKLAFQSERCNHCADAPCVSTCPTGASFVDEGGIVKVDPRKCIGCGACVESCPYDARYMNPQGYADKCTFCDHRLSVGNLPACVEVCPTNCMHFGDADDPESAISNLLKSRSVSTLHEEAGTKPHVYYLN